MQHKESQGNSASGPRLRTLLPVELIEQILHEAWSMDLRPSERTTLYTTLCLTSHTFLSLFIRLALTDVHITTPAYATHYLLLLRTLAPHEPNSTVLLPASQTANTLCRTLTFHIDARASCPPDTKPAIKLYSSGDPSAQAVSSTLYMLDLMSGSVPNLRKVTVEYTDWGFDDVFDQRRLVPMPKQVEELDVGFRFSAALEGMRMNRGTTTKRRTGRMYARHLNLHPSHEYTHTTTHTHTLDAPAEAVEGKTVLEDLRRRYEITPHPFGRFALPHVRKLRVFGSTTSFAAGMLEACPGAEEVTFDEYVELPVVPPWIRTVVVADGRGSGSKGAGEMVRETGSGSGSGEWVVVAARSVCAGREEVGREEVRAVLGPGVVMDREHERARRRLKTFCERNGVRVVDI